MYHHTPIGPAQSRWDVPLQNFKAQIDQLGEAGVTFVEFEQIPRESSSKEVKVCVTFDDGHASNAAAFEYLASRAIRPSAFIVSDWSRNDPDFLDASSIKALADICDFGGHGATHTGLSSLNDAALSAELTASRVYLEDVLGKSVTTMALPGGVGGSRELRAAREAGYLLIGNSVADLNRELAASLNRICVTSDMSLQTPRDWARAGERYWFRKRVMRSASRLSASILGQDGHAAVASRLKKLAGR